jgi:hypothetical protein
MSNRNSITPGHTAPKAGHTLTVIELPHGGFLVSIPPAGWGEAGQPVAAFSTPEEAGAYLTNYLVKSTLARMEANVDARS